MELNEKIGKRDVGFCRVLRNVGVMPRGRIGLYEFWKSVGFDTVPRQQVRRRRSEWILHATDRGGGVLYGLPATAEAQNNRASNWLEGPIRPESIFPKFFASFAGRDITGCRFLNPLGRPSNT
ncbi:hypothetical protein TcCL_NonESM08909 [Trypanosoma cruzi]|nr:hypothetical protein TcCL_NonESM08909 [Trypanosoma cruzi]